MPSRASARGFDRVGGWVDPRELRRPPAVGVCSTRKSMRAACDARSVPAVIRASSRSLFGGLRRAASLPRLDAAMAAVLVVVSQCEVWLNSLIVPKAPNAALELVAAIAVAWRRRAPLTAATVVALSGMAQAATGVPMNQPSIPTVTAVMMAYAVISYLELRRAIVGTAIITLGVSAEVLIAGQSVGALGFVYTFVGLAWALGRVVRIRTNQAVHAELEIERLRSEKEQQARQVAAQERARIARELHDVIAHSVSVMVIQAGAAQKTLRHNASDAERALDFVRDTGQQAIGELGRLLGVLRDDSAEIGLAPQPTLAELPTLIAETCRAGLPVSLRTEGTPRPFAAGVELAVYRIVQEALTNTRKHAGPASSASVLLRYGPGEVAVEITDDGAGTSNGYGGGHGLVGMRERVTAYGGTFAAGRSADGGFAVTARIPVQVSE